MLNLQEYWKRWNEMKYINALTYFWHILSKYYILLLIIIKPIFLHPPIIFFVSPVIPYTFFLVSGASS